MLQVSILVLMLCDCTAARADNNIRKHEHLAKNKSFQNITTSPPTLNKAIFRLVHFVEANTVNFPCYHGNFPCYHGNLTRGGYKTCFTRISRVIFSLRNIARKILAFFREQNAHSYCTGTGMGLFYVPPLLVPGPPQGPINWSLARQKRFAIK
jgi:hypothetical protein